MIDSRLMAITYSDAPLVRFYADCEAGAARCLSTILAAGGRAAPSGYASDLHDQEMIAVDPFLVDLEQDQHDATDAVLASALRMAERVPVVIHFPRALTDLVTARTDHPNLSWLCDATPLEAAATLGAVLLPRPVFVHERGTEDANPRLQQLSDEVQRIARALAQLSTQADEPLCSANGDPRLIADPNVKLPTAAAVKAMIRARRLREQFFDPDLFADPAWDMLLDLLLAHVEGRLVAVSSLCIAAAVPPTTALRWIKRMTDERLFVRTADPNDGRRIFIELAPTAARQLAGYVQALSKLAIALP